MDEIYESKAIYFDEETNKEAEWYMSLFLSSVQTWAMVLDDNGDPHPERTEIVGNNYSVTLTISYDEFSRIMKEFNKGRIEK